MLTGNKRNWLPRRFQWNERLRPASPQDLFLSPHAPHPALSRHPLPLPQARDNGPLLSVFATLRRDRAEAEGEGGRGEGAHAARPNHRLTLGRRISARESLWDKVFGGPPKTARQRRALPLMGAIKKPRMAPGLG
jgi:hypothetical protein